MHSNPLIQWLTSIVTLNNSFNWKYVGTYLFNSAILQGVVITVVISVLAQLIGSVIGLLLYFLRRSRVRILRGIGNVYVVLFRGTPLLVQILFLYEFLPIIHVARPLLNTHFFASLGFTNPLPLDAFIAALAALSFNEGAYMAEIVRAGIDSIDVGQLEAAKSLGMTYSLAMRRIVLPQALRVIVPPLGNEFNSMLKSSSLASVIALTELLAASEAIYSSLGAPLELLFVASLWYLALTTAWSFVQSWIERKLNASNIEPIERGGQRWWKRTFGVSVRPTGELAPGLVLPGGDTRGAR